MKNKIIYLYQNKKWSANKIGKYYNCSHKKIIKILKENNIIIRNRAEANIYTKNIIGKTFGRWIVLKYDKKSKYICQCRCGVKKSVSRNSLINKKSKSCGCWNSDKASRQSRSWKFLKKSLRRPISLVYESYKRHAKIRKQVFYLSKEEFGTLIIQKCYYCGKIDKRNFNGIDRVDNKKGYTLQNCVACCNYCNHAKWNLSKTIFLNHINRIANFQRRK